MAPLRPQILQSDPFLLRLAERRIGKGPGLILLIIFQSDPIYRLPTADAAVVLLQNFIFKIPPLYDHGRRQSHHEDPHIIPAAVEPCEEGIRGIEERNDRTDETELQHPGEPEPFSNRNKSDDEDQSHHRKIGVAGGEIILDDRTLM